MKTPSPVYLTRVADALASLDEHLRGHVDENWPEARVAEAAEILRGLLPTKRFRVTVQVKLQEGATAADAEIERSGLGEHVYEVDSYHESAAEELALDQYHDEHAIGVLDLVEIVAVARLSK